MGSSGTNSSSYEDSDLSGQLKDCCKTHMEDYNQKFIWLN